MQESRDAIIQVLNRHSCCSSVKEQTRWAASQVREAINDLGSMVLPASLSPASGYDRPRNMLPCTRSRRARVDECVSVGTCTWNAQRRAVAGPDGPLGRRLLHLVGSRRVTEFIPPASPLRHPKTKRKVRFHSQIGLVWAICRRCVRRVAGVEGADEQ